jgi:hypothetical protein
VDEFSTKERARFRKLLEVANSSTFTGERDAALAAATRLAAAHGMTLREAAGMSESEEREPARRKPAGFHSDFGAAMRAAGLHREHRAGRMYARHNARAAQASEEARLDAEKRRFDAAMADAIRRGLDAEERAAAARPPRPFIQRTKRNGFRNRAEFIRVLLAETGMSAREIASTAGVTIYDVFREKLLMRKKQPAA